MEQSADLLLVSRLDEYRIAIPLNLVVQVIRAVAITPVHGFPNPVKGVIDLHGVVIPAVNIRRLFNLPEKKPASSDRFIILELNHRKLAVITDDTEKIIPRPVPEPEPAGPAWLNMAEAGFMISEGKLILVTDPERFLTREEGIQLDAMLHQHFQKENP